MTTQPIQTTNVIISLQNTITIVMLNTTTQPQNTTAIPNIFNLTSQPMEITTETIAGGSSFQNNVSSVRNTEGGYFSHFSIIGANPLGGFRTFGENNNNNNPLLLPSLGFEKGLGGGFNPPSRRNVEELDPNVIALVNVLT